MKIKKIFKASLFFASIMPFIAANAEIIIHGTRIIYPSDSREITIQVTNDGKEPSLVQTWVDDGNANSAPSDAKAPFMITPPISRVDPKKVKHLDSQLCLKQQA